MRTGQLPEHRCLADAMEYLHRGKFTNSAN